MPRLSLTCPGCRHVVELEEGASKKCPNCRTVVHAPLRTTPPASKPANGGGSIADGSKIPRQGEPDSGPTTPPGAPATPPTAPGAPTVPVPSSPVASAYTQTSLTRAASVVALVFGLLVFVPLLTQVVAIVAGLYAILRPRKARERVRLAWIGLVLGCTMLCVWILLINWFMSAVSTGPRFTWPPPRVALEADAWADTAALRTEMERIYDAAAAYHRDYQRWPEGVDELIGKSLPASFVPSADLTYRPVPESQSLSHKWILIVSKPVQYDSDGAPLAAPHRFVLTLGGKIDLLPAETVAELLASQPQDPDATDQAETPVNDGD